MANDAFWSYSASVDVCALYQKVGETELQIESVGESADVLVSVLVAPEELVGIRGHRSKVAGTMLAKFVCSKSSRLPSPTISIVPD